MPPKGYMLRNIGESPAEGKVYRPLNFMGPSHSLPPAGNSNLDQSLV